MGLREYHRKRDFTRTAEPRGGRAKKKAMPGASFVIQKHAATRLHHDFRLELDGVLLSWAVPKGPPTKPGQRCLAVRTEDHPIEYGTFEGVIPKGQYGGGTVMLWDHGTWRPEGDARDGLRAGKLDFTLHGERLRGRWSLVRMRTDGETKENWLLIKRSDDAAGERRVTAATVDESVTTGRSMADIAHEADRHWSSKHGEVTTTKPRRRTKPRVDHEPPRAAAVPTQRAGELPEARPAPFPKSLAPQLATLVEAAPAGDGWLHEVKFDGYRLLAFVDDGRVVLRTRTGQDWTERFAPIAAALAKLDASAVLDGEIVVLRDDGISDFQALQNWLDGSPAERASRLVYFVFDLPWCDGFDLSRTPLHERKTLLARVVADAATDGVVRYSEHVIGNGAPFFRQACTLSLEGVISKRVDAPYESRRSRNWVKTKCLQRQEFVVGGWTPPQGSRRHFGALLLGTNENGALRYAGKVGTGFRNATLASVMDALRLLETTTPPFVDPPRGAEGRRAHWVEPKVVVEVAFTGWTADGRLRHPSCQGVRIDKAAADVHRERPASAVARRSPRAPSPSRSSTTRTTVQLTNPDRILWPRGTGDAGPPRDLTKADLASYYEAVAAHVLPHVVGRPLTLVRCPRGAAASCFYQKHVAQTFAKPVRSWRVKEQNTSGDYVGIEDLDGLLTLVQFGALELHPWGSRGDDLEHPDRLVIDLDPGPDVAWSRVIAAAVRLREVLRILGLESFPRTTGGKGLHVVVPIAPRCTWDQVKSFSHDVVAALERDDPDSFVTVASKAKRHGRIFLDWLRNARGATAVATCSTRARPLATVAMPLQWSAVTTRLDPTTFTMLTVPKRLANGVDPWAGFFDVEQTLTSSMRAAVKTV